MSTTTDKSTTLTKITVDVDDNLGKLLTSIGQRRLDAISEHQSLLARLQGEINGVITTLVMIDGQTSAPADYDWDYKDQQLIGTLRPKPEQLKPEHIETSPVSSASN